MKAWLRKHWLVVTGVLMLTILALAIRAFIFNLEFSYFEGELHKPEVPVRTQQKAMVASAPVDTIPQQKVAKPALVSAIQPWMTFDYVNVVYKLPQHYMKDILGINDSRYPNIRIDSYAKQSSIDTELLVTTVRTYVTQYQTLNP